MSITTTNQSRSLSSLIAVFLYLFVRVHFNLYKEKEQNLISRGRRQEATWEWKTWQNLTFSLVLPSPIFTWPEKDNPTPMFGQLQTRPSDQVELGQSIAKSLVSTVAFVDISERFFKLQIALGAPVAKSEVEEILCYP